MPSGRASRRKSRTDVVTAAQYSSGGTNNAKATPGSNSVFQNWTVDGVVVSTAASYTFTVAADQILTAKFT